MAAVERRDIMEQVGVAVGASDLSSSELRETSVDLVAAVGAASARLHLGDQGIPIAGAALKPTGTREDRIAADLAPTLWHLKAGGQEQAALRTAGLFTQWLRGKTELSTLPGEQLHAFAAIVLSEWLSSRCAKCRGAGLLEQTRTGQKVAAHTFARNARFVTCNLCNGNKKGLPNHILRARLLGIERAVYDGDGWYRRFRVGHVWLEQIARRLRRPLQFETGRRRIAPK